MRLASQLLTNPTILITDGRVDGYPIFQIWQNLGGSRGWVFDIYEYADSPDARYPFGFGVRPDEHA